MMKKIDLKRERLFKLLNAILFQRKKWKVIEK